MVSLHPHLTTSLAQAVATERMLSQRTAAHVDAALRSRIARPSRVRVALGERSLDLGVRLLDGVADASAVIRAADDRRRSAHC